jgi:PAS domain S-box-containing protein
VKKLYQRVIGEKLAGKLIFVLVSVILLISLLFLGFFYQRNEAAQRAALNGRLENLVTVLQLGFSELLWSLDIAAIESLAQAGLADRSILAIDVYEGTRFLLGARRGLNLVPNVVASDSQPFSFPHGTRLDDQQLISGAIHFKEKQIGRFEIFFTEAIVREEAFRANQLLIFGFLVMAGVMIVVIYLLMEKTMVRPVLKLATISQQIAENPQTPVVIESPSGDEIGILYQRFILMLENLRKKQDELEEAQGHLADIINSMPSILLTMNQEGVVTQWNSAAEIHFHLPAAEVVGKTLTELPELFPGLREICAEAGKKAMPTHLYRQKSPGDHPRFFNLCLFPLQHKDAVGLVIRMDDVTELEVKERQLRQAQKMEIVGTLSGGLAHDFNNVLTAIIGTVSLMKYKLTSRPEPDQEILSLAATIEHAGKRSAELVRRLLALARKRDLELFPTNLNHVLKDVEAICKGTLDKSVKLQVTLAEAEALVMADQGQLEQVLLNLCVNAGHAVTNMRSHNEPHGGLLAVSLHPLDADWAFCAAHPDAHEQKYWVLSVEDDGVGMSPEVLAQVFDPFFSLKENGVGTGLGLVMVYNTVHQHHGFLTVYSQPGVGSTFKVFLPALVGVNAMTPASEVRVVPCGQGRILIIDDERMVRELAGKILQACGYEVVLAENGREGLDVFRREKETIDLVLLDLLMPVMGGRETFLTLRSLDEKVKILLTSGFKHDERVDEMARLGVRHFIQKPFTLEKLAEAVKTALDASQAGSI